MKTIACGLKGDGGSIVAGKDHLWRGKTHRGTATGLFFKEWSGGFHGLIVLNEYSGKASSHRLAGEIDEMRHRLRHDGPLVAAVELEIPVGDPSVVQGLMEGGVHPGIEG